MTNWIHRIHVSIPTANTTALNALWTLIAPEGDTEATTFGVPLSATGQEPVTHHGISTAATEYMRLAITDLFAVELANAAISIEPYTENNWPAFLAANGLQAIQPELP